MPMLSDNMQTVAALGDLPAEGWYHVRVKNVDYKAEEQRVLLQLASQDEGTTGRIIFDNPQVNHPMGLSKLKAYYQAAGYNPGPEGHDPEKILDSEFYVYVVHNTDGDKK